MTIQHSRGAVGIGIVILAGLLACSSEDATRQMSAEERYRFGMSYYHDGDFLEAIEELKIVTIQFGGTQWADDAQYYMAEARYMREEFVLAAYEYDVLIRTMSTSEFVRLARYRKATCYYNLSPSYNLDQQYTRKAIDEYQLFLEFFPTDTLAVYAENRISEMNTKLARKDYESGIIYLKMGYNKSATYYFDLVLEKFHDTEYAEPAMFYKAESLFLRRRYADAELVIRRFLDRYPDSSRRSEIQQLLDTVREELTHASS